MTDFLDTDISNPFYYGFMRDEEFGALVRSIVTRYGRRIDSRIITEELKNAGIDNPSPAQLEILDRTFDCY